MNTVTVSLPCTRVFCAVEVIAEMGTYLLMVNNTIVGQETPATPKFHAPQPLSPLSPLSPHPSRRTTNERLALQQQIISFFTARPGKAFKSREVADALLAKTPADRHAVSVALKNLTFRGTLHTTSNSRFPTYALEPNATL